MNRRDFASILGASLLIPSFSKGSTMAREKTFELNYAPHFGMFKNHAGPNELDQLQFMYDQGFTALEDNELMGRPVELQEKIGEKLAKLNMKMGVFVGGANLEVVGEEEGKAAINSLEMAKKGTCSE
jgi:hydroxypyruvate isomerase